MWAAESHANILAANALAGPSWAKTKRTQLYKISRQTVGLGTEGLQAGPTSQG
jgi:hypothetical protein